MTSNLQSALEACAEEPIHIPGTIQPRGMLLALDDAWRVTHSAGVDGRFLAELNPMGRELQDLVPADALQALRALPPVCPRPGRNAFATVDLTGRQGPITAEVMLHRNLQGTLILEFEPATTTPRFNAKAEDVAVEMLAATSECAVLHAACRSLRRLSGFDSVMAYTFEPDGSGTVVSEDLGETTTSYLGMRFPACDIPEQARRLYRRKRSRLIADIEYQPQPISAFPGAHDPLDLSDADLRSVSPLHLQYLRNMGVSATFACSLLAGHDLLGMIVCHHYSPRSIAPSVRDRATFIADLAASRVATFRDAAINRRIEHASRQNTELLHSLSRNPGDLDVLGREVDRILSLIEADGAAVLINGRFYAAGQTPDEGSVRRLADTLTRSGELQLGATECIAESSPDLAHLSTPAAGVLAVLLADQSSDTVLWFRSELTKRVRWAGDPTKPFVQDPVNRRLSPRGSFDEFIEIQRGRSIPWSHWELDIAHSVRASVANFGQQLQHLTELAAERRRSELTANEHAKALEQARREMQAARDGALAADGPRASSWRT